jgi:hypothetical protein
MYRYTFPFLAFSILLIFCISCSTGSQNVVTESNEGFEIRIYEVFGMD